MITSITLATKPMSKPNRPLAWNRSAWSPSQCTTYHLGRTLFAFSGVYIHRGGNLLMIHAPHSLHPFHGLLPLSPKVDFVCDELVVRRICMHHYFVSNF